MIESIQYFKFFIGGYFGHSGEMIISDGKMKISSFSRESVHIDTEILPFTTENKELLLHVLNKIHIDKWNSAYLNESILDGTHWDCEIKFNETTHLKTGGSNAYPMIVSKKPLIVESNSGSKSPEFKKLLKTLNLLADKKDLFY